MSAAAKVKTYAARADGVYPLTFEISQPADLRVYLSDCDGDVEMTRGVDYSLSGVEKGAQSITVSKSHDGAVTLACVPCVDFELQKFGVSMLPDLNEWAVRLAQRVAYLEARLDRAASVPLGGACKDDCALPVLVNGGIVWVAAADLKEFCGLSVLPDDVVVSPDVVASVARVKAHRIKAALLDCETHYCAATKFDVGALVCGWPVVLNRYSKPSAAVTSVHYKPEAFCIFDFCKSAVPWQSDTLAIVVPTEKPILEFIK